MSFVECEQCRSRHELENDGSDPNAVVICATCGFSTCLQPSTEGIVASVEAAEAPFARELGAATASAPVVEAVAAAAPVEVAAAAEETAAPVEVGGPAEPAGPASTEAVAPEVTLGGEVSAPAEALAALAAAEGVEPDSTPLVAERIVPVMGEPPTALAEPPAPVLAPVEPPAPERPVPERPVPERPVPERPVPERPVPERPVLEEPPSPEAIAAAAASAEALRVAAVEALRLATVEALPPPVTAQAAASTPSTPALVREEQPLREPRTKASAAAVPGPIASERVSGFRASASPIPPSVASASDAPFVSALPPIPLLARLPWFTTPLLIGLGLIGAFVAGIFVAPRIRGDAAPQQAPAAVGVELPAPVAAPEPELDTMTEQAPLPSAKAQASRPRGPFDVKAAGTAVAKAASRARSCKRGGPSGTAVVTVTFAPSGYTTSALVSGDYANGTAAGNCIAGTLRAIRVPPFSGEPVSVKKSIRIE